MNKFDRIKLALNQIGPIKDQAYAYYLDMVHQERVLKDELKEVCDHPKDQWLEEGHWDEGGGMERAKPVYYERRTCEKCGKVLAHRYETNEMGEWQ